MYILFWLAISAGMHSFPSDQDMNHIKIGSRVALKEGGSLLHYLAFPFVWLVWLGNKLRIIWFDAIWAVMLVSIGGGFNAITKDITSTSSSRQNILSAQIDICKTTVATLEDQANNDQTTLNTMDAQMTKYDTDGDNTNYNSLVDPYNTLLEKVKAELSNYDTQLAECNKMIDQYNSNR